MDADHRDQEPPSVPCCVSAKGSPPPRRSLCRVWGRVHVRRHPGPSRGLRDVLPRQLAAEVAWSHLTRPMAPANPAIGAGSAYCPNLTFCETRGSTDELNGRVDSPSQRAECG